MSARKHQLTQLLKIAQQNEMEAARILSSQQQVHQQHRLQLDNLVQYQQAYRKELQGLSNDVASIGNIQRYYDFIGSLDLAIKQQHKTIHQSTEQLTSTRTLWQQQNQKTLALEHLLKNLAEQEQAALEKYEQRQQDEGSIQRFFKRD